jgi:hypothetical protein
MSILDDVVKASTKASPVAPASSESAGLKAKKENVDSYMRATSGEPESPKATPPQQNVDRIRPKARYGSRPGERRPGPDGLPMMQSYETGTDYVPKTGPAILHKGEKVVPAKENMKDLFSMVPGKGSEKPPKKEIKHIITSKTHDGKYMHKHVHHHPSHEDEVHVSNDLAGLKDHMAAHADGGADSDAAQMTASPSPAAPAPAAPAGAPAGM